jgi:hypothetical protein
MHVYIIELSILIHLVQLSSSQQFANEKTPSNLSRLCVRIYFVKSVLLYHNNKYSCLI